ncbi:T9SS C-terminal target domain-containing protein [Parabacteroides sp. TM07-1AC]|uniref:Ig-like domain-containing protein n=1 Tax=Parabacteroides sp. TM07-1AC TaxID=2292363 RepID=UPI000EFEEA61|nr:Ig-like domain-containing protein [Parabacteroides sp. TM07-1AC]RHU28890.1 T9SS C-terminal target domain-containing protein [Parabacteroides sp. TM07-1AC]
MNKILLTVFAVILSVTTNSGWAQTSPIYQSCTLGSWENDRTEPLSWDISGDWITFSTKTEPHDNWFSWHGKTAQTNMTMTDNWVVETQLKLTDELLKRNGVRTSLWLNVFNEKGVNADWSILQFNIDNNTHTKGWQYWISTGDGEWKDISADKNIPVVAGTYTIKISYQDGKIIQYINNVEVNSYDVPDCKMSYVKGIIFNSFSFGDSYATTWKVPSAKFVAGKSMVSTDEELKKAVADESVSSITLAKGNYTADLTIDRAIDIVGAGSGENGTTITGVMNITATNGAKVNLSELHLTPNNINNKAITVGTASGTETPVVTATNCVIDKAQRGFNILSVGAQVYAKSTNIDVTYYAISLCNEKQKISIEGGTIQGWAAIMTTANGGLSSPKGDIASTGTEIVVNNATLISKILSNENYGVIVLQEKYNGISATITNSTLTAIGDNQINPQYSAILDIRSYNNVVTVTNSELNCTNGANEAGGAVVSLGWSHADFGREYEESVHFSQVKDYSIPTTNTVTIGNDCRIAMKEGEKLVVTSRTTPNQEKDKLTIKGEIYTVSKGNVYRQYQEGYVGSKWVTVDDEGSPMATDAESLKEQIEKATPNATINLLPVTYKLESPLQITKAIKLTSVNANQKATLKGNITIEADGVILNNLNIETESTGTKYWQKNAISVISQKVTITNCDFKGSVQAGHGNEWVVNGIVLFPTSASPTYTVSGNTFTMFKGTTSDKKWTATAIIMADGYTLDKKENGQVVLPVVSNFNETAIANANTYTDCFADYIHMTNSKYVYSRTQSADGVADAWLSMDKGTIEAPAVTNSDVLTALNNTTKPALTDKAIAIRCSDAWLVTNESLAGNDLPVLIITKSEDTYEVVKKTVAPTIENSTLKASTIEAGQTLSASVLSGGKAMVDGKEIAGTFAWEDPKTVVAEGEQTYPVVFTPNDLSTYSAAKTTHTFSGNNAIKQYYTVTAGKCENGRVEIKEANAANRYLKGSTLTLLYHPDANYKTKAGAETTLSVTEDKVVTTTFDAIMHTVTIVAGENGSVSVNGKTYTGNSNTISMQQGSELGVQAIPATDYVGSLTCSDSKVISNGVVTVDKPFTINASFTAKPKDQFVVSVPAVQNGKILLYDKDGNAIDAGSSVVSGTVVSVLAVPDLGYELTEGSLKNNDTSISGGKITVTAAASITATFKKETFAVTKTEQNATITITGYENLKQVPYGTELTANVTPKDNYKLLSLVVNGKEIANGGTFTVTAITEVKAVMRKLATIVIDNTPQTFVYDGNKKEFVVKTIPAGIGGFTVKYEGTPQEVDNHIQKAYKVIITRPADDVYAEVTAEQGTIENGLVILAAEMKGVAIPTASGGSLNTNPNADLGSYAWEGGSVGDQEPIHDAIFTPTSGNYKKATFSILTGKGTTPKVVTLDWNGLQTRSTTPNVTFSVNGGSLIALNGSASLSSGSTLYAGQKIRLVATPDATHAAKVSWSVTGGTLSDKTATEATLTLAENTVVTATFATKSSPVFPGLEGLDKVVYDGTIYGTGTPGIKSGNDAVTDNWSITFKQGSVATSTPINAGTYDIYVSRPADVIYSAVIDQKVGSFTIAQKQVTASVTAATSVLKGQSLAQSVLSGTADVDGSFVWIDPTVLMTKTGDQKAKFVPANANYKESGELTANVTVNEATGVTLRTLNVTITNPEKGTVTMTLNGREVVAGASVTKDDKLIVTYTATAANYKASATIGGSDYKSGAEYIVPESGNVEVAVSFTWNNPGTGTDPEPGTPTVDVTGITLEPTSQTLSVNETLALKATVAPVDATDKGISWSSSAPDIVSVDTKGNLKALKAGTATITATTNDGGFTATCKITVSVPTGIEDILSGTRVYAQDGSIVLEPAITVQVLVSDMTGRVIWQGKLSEKKQMAVSAGVYIVRLSNVNGVQTQKVIVQ